MQFFGPGYFNAVFSIILIFPRKVEFVFCLPASLRHCAHCHCLGAYAFELQYLHSLYVYYSIFQMLVSLDEFIYYFAVNQG